MPYLMENVREAERLLMKSDEETSRHQLLMTGLREGLVALDAGGGAGFVSKIMSDIVGPKGRVILADQSKERLEAAQNHIQAKNAIFLQTPLEEIKLESNTVDYVFCRFVFEYLPDQRQVFNELLRVCKVGGRLVIGDLDYNCLSHHPINAHLEQQLFRIVKELENLKLWDAYAGRKLYSFFSEAHFSEVKVHLLPHHLIYGNADRRDVSNWQMKLDQLISLQKKKVLNLDFDLETFKNEFFAFFENPTRFSYSPLILVEGVKTAE